MEVSVAILFPARLLSIETAMNDRTPRRIRLYVSGRSPHSETAISAIRRIAKDYLDDSYEIEVIDILANPTAAFENGILATPTVIKDFPPGPQRVVGQLSNVGHVLEWLGVKTGSARGGTRGPVGG